VIYKSKLIFELYIIIY